MRVFVFTAIVLVLSGCQSTAERTAIAETRAHTASQNGGNLNNLSEADQIKYFERNGYNRSSQHYMKLIESPSEAVQLAAIKSNGADILKSIKSPTESAKLAAVNVTPSIIADIKNPSISLQLAAMERSESGYTHNRNPAEEVTVAFVRKDPKNILKVGNPSLAVQQIVASKISSYDEYIFYFREIFDVRKQPRFAKWQRRLEQESGSSSNSSSNSSSTNSSPQKRSCRDVQRVKTVPTLGGRPGQKTQVPYYETVCN